MKFTRAARISRLLTPMQRHMMLMALLTGLTPREALSIARTW